MDDIRGILRFKQARIKSLTLTPNKAKEPTASLSLNAELTPDQAIIMRCRDSIFRHDGKPHPNVSRHDIDGILRDVDLSLPAVQEGVYDRYRPEDIASFRAEVDGMQVRINMLIRIKGRYADLVELLEKVNADDFDFAIRSLQNEFDFDGAVGGTRAAVGEAGKAEANGELFRSHLSGIPVPIEQCISTGCLFCDRDIPKNEDGRHIYEGELAECQADRRGPAIPDVREMGQRRAKRQKTRADMAGPTEEELQQRVEVVN